VNEEAEQGIYLSLPGFDKKWQISIAVGGNRSAMDKPRTLAEIKNDIRGRVGHRAPFNHADKQEAEEVLAKLCSVDGEAWAMAWNELGARWEQRARAAEAAGKRDEAKQAYLKSYGYYGIGRHPFPSTPGKQHAYLKAREMHLAASRYFDIPLERIGIPFNGREIVGHLRLPKKTPAPLVMHWGGIDNWKEEHHTFAERFVKEGWSCLVLDSPGTGECPMLASPEAHQVHVAALDYMLKRREIDPDSIAVVGASFGGYWATKLAHVEPKRLRAVVNWGGGIRSTPSSNPNGKSARATLTLTCLTSLRRGPTYSARRRWTS
jgi:esterase FrsA